MWVIITDRAIIYEIHFVAGVMKGSNYCTHNYYMTHKERDVISKNITIQFDAFILSLIVIHCSYVNFMNNTKIWFAIFKNIASHSLLQFDDILAYDEHI